MELSLEEKKAIISFVSTIGDCRNMKCPICCLAEKCKTFEKNLPSEDQNLSPEAYWRAIVKNFVL